MHDAGRSAAPLMSNPRADRVKEAAKLAGRSARLKTGRFLAEGPQAVREALIAHRAALAEGRPGVVVEAYATQACLDRLPGTWPNWRIRPPCAWPRTKSWPPWQTRSSPQGIVAVCRIQSPSLEDVLAARPKLLAVMCEVRDPGNAGTILRAADSAGADAVILTASSVDIHNPKAVRSTVGSLFHLPVVSGRGLC